MRDLLFYFLIFLIAMTANVSLQAGPDDELNALFTDYDEYNKRTYPEGATYEGDHRYDDLLYDNSESAVIAYYDSMRGFLGRLNSIEYEMLSFDSKLNHDLFKSSLEDAMEDEKFKWYYTPMGQQWGLHINFPQLVFVQPMNT
jgi:uncharacterized protein (DUF885 family)